MSRKLLFAAAVCLCLDVSASADAAQVIKELLGTQTKVAPAATIDMADILLQSQKNDALILYNQKNYEAAYELYSILYLSALGDAKINFLLGRCAFETGRYEVALAAFERVEMLEATNIRNQLEIARTQYKLGMLEDARLGFQKVLSNPGLPSNVRRNIELFAAEIDNQMQKSFFFGRAKLGGVYDSNVNYGFEDTIYFSNLPFSNKPESDYAYDIELGLVHIYDIGEKNGYSLRNSLTLFNRDYTSLNTFDTTYLSYSPALLFQDLKNTYELNVMLDHMMLDGQDYLNIYSIMPNIIHTLDATTRLIANLKYSMKSFLLPGDESKDANNYALSMAYQKLWSSDYMTFSLSAESEKKSRGTRVDVDYNGYRLYFDYSKQFFPTMSVKFDAEVQQRDYQDYDFNFKSTRQDQGYKTGVTLTKKLTPSLYGEVRAAYENMASNQSVYAYDKSSCNVTLNKSF